MLPLEARILFSSWTTPTASSDWKVTHLPCIQPRACWDFCLTALLLSFICCSLLCLEVISSQGTFNRQWHTMLSLFSNKETFLSALKQSRSRALFVSIANKLFRAEKDNSLSLDERSLVKIEERTLTQSWNLTIYSSRILRPVWQQRRSPIIIH